MFKVMNFGRYLFDRYIIESDWWFNGVRFIIRFVYCLMEGFFVYQYGRVIKFKNEFEVKVLLSRDFKVFFEEGKFLLDDGVLFEDYFVIFFIDDVSVDYDLCKFIDKKKMMRLILFFLISFDI